MERTVRIWASYNLVHHVGRIYELIPADSITGFQVRAETDEEAIQKAAEIVKEKDKR